MTGTLNLPFYRLFVLGAGFSKPAGLPLGNELLELVRESVKREYRHYDWEGPLEQEIQEWMYLYPDQKVNLERVLAYSHRKHYLRLLGSDEYFDHGSRSVVAVRRSIQEILTRSTPRYTPSVYRAFAESLSPNDVVITFNYDTLVEQSLDDVAKPYSLTPEWWLKRDTPASGQQYVDLLKLHGSIDWYDRYYHDDAVCWHARQGHDVPDRDPIFGPSPSIVSEPLSRGETAAFGKKILSRVFRVPNHANLFPINGERFSHVVPFLLPPAYDKLLGYDPVLDLWENLHRTLDSFSAIVIIGYSMPSYDSYAYETLGRLLIDYQEGGCKTYWDQRRVPVQVVSLDDSAAAVLSGVPFLDLNNTRVWHRGFSDAALRWIDWGDGERQNQ